MGKFCKITYILAFFIIWHKKWMVNGFLSGGCECEWLHEWTIRWEWWTNFFKMVRCWPFWQQQKLIGIVCIESIMLLMVLIFRSSVCHPRHNTTLKNEVYNTVDQQIHLSQWLCYLDTFEFRIATKLCMAIALVSLYLR